VLCAENGDMLSAKVRERHILWTKRKYNNFGGGYTDKDIDAQDVGIIVYEDKILDLIFLDKNKRKIEYIYYYSYNIHKKEVFVVSVFILQ